MTQPEPEVVEGELVHVEQPSINLIGSSDPEVFLTRVGAIANALAVVIRKQDLAVTIRGREHVRVEGWTCLGSLLGVFPELEWSRPIDGGWEARVIAHTRAGETVGAAESMCTRSESRWRTADDYAIRSMASTRATSKALRQPLGFVIALAGFDPTPLEEMPQDEPPAGQKDPGPIQANIQPTHAQKQHVRDVFARLAELDPDTDWADRAREIAGCPNDHLTVTIMGRVIGTLETELEALQAERAHAADEKGL
jgi:hypothetical protein